MDFAVSEINVELSASSATPFTGSGTIASFYNNSIDLSDGTYEGAITGRFIDSNAKGVIANYIIKDQGGSNLVGTAAFERP